MHDPRQPRFAVAALAATGLVMLLAGCSPEPPPPATAANPPAPPATSAHSGAELFHNCQLCHSTREMQRGPILEGLPAWYVEDQLRKFRDGQRGRNEANKSELLMGAGGSILQDDGEIRRVAAHIAAQPPARHLLTVRGDALRGRRLYEPCAVCHGAQAEGKPEVKGPPLNTLEDWYQLEQLRKFKHGLRGTHPQDIEGQLMRAVMAEVQEEDFKDIIRYLCEMLPAAKRENATP